MDLFTGKKIADLRKFNSLSQEGLAEKMGVSRQAISKWERGEASPDMDNIIALARIFNVTVDDLLGDKKAHELTAAEPAVQSPCAVTEQQPEDKISEEPKKEKRIRLKKEKKQKTHYKPHITKKMNRIPVFIIVPILYLLLGITQKAWHPGWLIAFAIPVYYFTSFAFNAKDRRVFFLKLPVPFVLIPVFLFCGFVYGAWHPAWMIFLILPVYYWIAAMVKK